MTVQESIARLNESTARLHARSASLRATMQRWADVMTAKLERRIPSSDPMPMRQALGSEKYILPRWKRRPHSFDAFPNGETVVIGSSPAHTVRMRRDYSLGDCQYLQSVALASYAITAEEADAILRRSKPNTSRPKRKPMDADPDVPSTDYRQREPRYLSPEELIRSQFSGRALARELRRIGK